MEDDGGCVLLEGGGEGLERGQVGRVKSPLVGVGEVTLYDIERGYAGFGVAFEEELDEAMSEEAFACEVRRSVSSAAGECG